MANESFTRASCVGCGMCAHVCPRGVLKLENKSSARAKAGQPIRVYGVNP
jgi:formate hydrogenlyase subunit 6/NADH:ubiquinone oxidoreductase subunit I